MSFNLDSKLRERLGNIRFDAFIKTINSKSAAELSGTVMNIGGDKANLIQKKREELGRIVSVRDLLQIKGINFESVKELIRSELKSDEERTKLDSVFESLGGATEEELLREALITPREEESMLEFLNGVRTKEELAKAVKGVGVGIAEDILVERDRLGGKFDRYMEVELIPNLGKVRMNAIINRIKAAPVNTSIGALDRSQLPVKRLLENIERAPSKEWLRERVKSFTDADAKNVIAYRDSVSEIRGLQDLLHVKRFGIDKLFRSLDSSTTTTDERNELKITREKMGNMSEPELHVLLNTNESTRRSTLDFLRLSPSPEALADMIPGIGKKTAGALFERFRENPNPDAFVLTGTPGISDDRLEEVFVAGTSMTDLSGREDIIILNLIHELLNDKDRRDQWEDELLRFTTQVQDLRSLQYIGAALLVINAKMESIHQVIEMAGSPIDLGIPLKPWAAVQKGKFDMGSPDNDEFAEPDEKPQHEVTLESSFEMLAMPITNAIYHILGGIREVDVNSDLRDPVTFVDWNIANTAAQKMTEFQGQMIRLPREAEWEFACRANSETRFWTGDDPSSVASAAWTTSDSENKQFVIQKAQNPFHLFGVHGNVWEWTGDTYESYVPGAPKVEVEERMVLRGGSFLSDPTGVRSANRLAQYKDYSAMDAGFRVIRPLLENGQGAPAPQGPKEGGPQNTPFLPGHGIVGAENVAMFPEFILKGGAPSDFIQLTPTPVLVGGMPMDAHLMPDQVFTSIGDPWGGGCYLPLPDGMVAQEVIEDDPCADCPCPPCPPNGGQPADPNLPGEDELLDELEEEAKKAKEAEDEKERERQRKEKEQAEKDEQDAKDEEERRKKDKKYRQRREAEEQLERDKEALEEEKDGIDRDKKTIEDEDKRIADKDKELREKEQRARDAGDPNCRGPKCQGIKAEREQLSQDRVDNQKAKNDLGKRQREFDQKAKQHANNVDALERAKDRGFGMNKEERASRRAQQRLGALENEQRSAQENIDRLKAKEKEQGGLSREDRHELEQYEKYEGRLDKAIGDNIDEQIAKQGEIEANEARMDQLVEQRDAENDPAKKADIQRQINEAGEKDHQLNNELEDLKDAHQGKALHKATEALKAETGADTVSQAMRTKAIRNLNDADLKSFKEAAGTAVKEYEHSSRIVGQPGADPSGGIDAGQRKANGQRYNDALDRQQQIRDDIDQAKADIDQGKADRRAATDKIDRIKAELNRLGHSEFSSPNGPNAERVAELQQEARDTRNAMDAANDKISGAQQDLRNLNDDRRAAARETLLSEPLGKSSNTFDRVFERNAQLEPYFDSEGGAKPALRQEIHQQFSLFGRENQLEAREGRLQKAIDSGKAPEGTTTRLRQVQAERAQVQDGLKARGWDNTGKDDSLIPDGKNFIGRGFLKTFSKERVNARRAQREEDMRKQREAARETQRRNAEARRKRSLQRGAKTSEDGATQQRGDKAEEIEKIGSDMSGEAAEDAAIEQDKAAQEQNATMQRNGIVMERFIKDTTGIDKDDPLFNSLSTYAGMMGPVLFKAFMVRKEEEDEDQTTTKRKNGIDLVKSMFEMNRYLMLQAGGHFAATAVIVAQKQVTDEYIDEVEVEIETITSEVEAEQRKEELRKAKEMRLDNLDDMIEEYDQLEEDSQRRSSHEGATMARVSRAAAEAEKRILEGEDVDIDEELEKLEDEIGDEITIARLAGDDALAGRLNRVLVDAQMALQKALRKQLEEDDDEEATVERVEDIKAVSSELVESLNESQEISLELAEDADNRDDKATHERNANIAGGLAATNLIETDEFSKALDKIKSLPDDFEKDWKAQLLQHAFILMKGQEAALQPDGEEDEGATIERWRNLEDDYLRELRETTDDPQVKKDVDLTLAEHRNQAGDRDGALTILRGARKNAQNKKDRDLALHLIRTLLSGDLTEDVMKEVYDILGELEDIPENHELDRMATVSMLNKLQADQLDRFREILDDHPGFKDKRKNGLLFMFDMAVLSKDAQEGITATQLQQRLTDAQGLLNGSNLPDFLKEKAQEDIDNFQNPLTEYNNDKSAFQTDPKSIPMEKLPQLLFGALNFQDFDLAEDIIKFYEEGDADTAHTRIKMVYGFARLFQEARMARRQFDDFSRWDNFFKLAEQTAETITEKAVEEMEADLAEVLKDGMGPDPEPDGEWGWKSWLFHASTMGTFVITHLLYDEIKERMDAPSAEELATAENERTILKQKHVSDKQSLQLILSEIKMMNEGAFTASSTVREERERIEKELEELVKDAYDFIDSITEDTVESRETMSRKRAAIISKQLELFAWEDQAMMRGEFRYYNAKDYDKLTSPAEIAAAELIDTLYGTDMFGEYGLMGELDELLDETEDDDTIGQWKIRLKKEQIEMVRHRIASLIGSGPILDPNHGGVVDDVYRKHLQSVILDAERERIKDILREYQILMDEDGVDYWDETQQRYQQRLDQINEIFSEQAELSGFLELDESYSTQSFAFGLLRGLILMRNMGNEKFNSYIPEGRMDRGIVQMWNLYYSDTFHEIFGGENEHSLNSITKNLEELDLKIGELERGILAVIRGKELTEGQRKVLNKYKLIEESTDDDGNTVVRMVIPPDLDLSDLNDELNLPEKSVWDAVFNTKTMLETLAIVVTGGLLSGLAAAEVGLWATRLKLGRALVVGAEVATEAAVFTGVSRGVRAAFGEETQTVVHDPGFEVQGLDSRSIKRIRAEKPGVLTEFAHNLVFFGAFRGFSAVSQGASKMTGVADRVKNFKGKWWQPNKDLVVNGARLLNITSGAAMATGINAALTGEKITLHGFVQNLIDFPLAHRLSGSVIKGYKGMRATTILRPPRGRRQAFNTARLGRDPKINPELQARWEKMLEPLMKEFGTDKSKLDLSIAGDRARFETMLRDAGIELRDSNPGDGTYLKMTVDGKFILFADAAATRIDILNEAFKAGEIAIREIGTKAPFTAKLEAIIELASWQKMERSLFKGEKPIGRYATSIGRSLAWHKRLAGIRSGKIPNTILHGPGEGLVIFGQKPYKASQLRKKFKQHLGTDSRAVNPDLRLKKSQRELLTEMLNRLDALEAKIQDLDSRARKETDATKAEQLTNDMLAAKDEYAAQGATLLNILSLLRQRTSASKTPDVFAKIIEGTEFRLDPTGSKYLQMENARADLRADIAKQEKALQTATTKKQRETIKRDLAKKNNELKKMSEELGEQMAYDIVQSHPELKGADLIYVGSGSRVLDLVFVKGDRVFIVEAKGGKGKLISKDAFGKRVEQLTPANILKTVMEMLISGEANKNSTDPQKREDALYRLDAVNKIFEGLQTGKLELYLTSTPWIKRADGREVAGTGVMHKVELGVGPTARQYREVVVTPARSIGAIAGKLQTLRSEPAAPTTPRLELAE